MDYYVTCVRDNGRTILSQHKDKESAMVAGKTAWMNAKKGDLISVIQANLDENNQVVGKYTLYQSWM